jgi:hypothetical protein
MNLSKYKLKFLKDNYPNQKVILTSKENANYKKLIFLNKKELKHKKKLKIKINYISLTKIKYLIN